MVLVGKVSKRTRRWKTEEFGPTSLTVKIIKIVSVDRSRQVVDELVDGSESVFFHNGIFFDCIIYAHQISTQNREEHKIERKVCF